MVHELLNKRTLSAFIVGSSLLITPHDIYGLSREELLKNIKIVDVYGGVNQFVPHGVQVPKISELNQPLKWGHFLNLLKAEDPVASEILRYPEQKLAPLVMTKDEVYTAIRSFIQLKGKTNKVSDYRIRTMVFATSPTRNYLTQGEFNELFGRVKQMKVENGNIIENVLVVIQKLEGSTLLVSQPTLGKSLERLVLGSGINLSEIKYGNVYNVELQGEEVVGISPAYEIQLGKINNGKVNDYTISNLSNVKNGEYVTYFVKDSNEVVILDVLGLPQTYIVKGSDYYGVEDLYGEILDRDLQYMDLKFASIDPRTIKLYSIVDVLNDKALVNSSPEKVNVRYYKDELYINNVKYDPNDVLISDGLLVTEVSKFDDMEYITSADAYKNIEGIPKILVVEKIHDVVYVIEVNKEEVIAVGTDGRKSYNLSWNYQGERLRADNVYKLISPTVDGKQEVIDAKRLKSIDIQTSDLRKTKIRKGNKSYSVLETTPVMLINKNSNNDDSYNVIDYSELYSEYEDKIGNGYIDMELYCEGDDVLFIKAKYIEIEGDTTDKLRSTPLSLYKITNIDIKSDPIKFTLSDNVNDVKFSIEKTNNNIEMLKNINNGDYVIIDFDNRRNVNSIREFSLDASNIETSGLSSYLGLTSSNIPTLGYKKGSADLEELRKIYNLYEEIDGSLRKVDLTTELSIKDYFMFRGGSLSRIIITE